MKAYQNFMNSLLRPRIAHSTISATRCHSITIVWVCLVSFATITLCTASKWAFLHCVPSVICNASSEGKNMSYVWLQTQWNCIRNTGDGACVYYYNPETKQQFSYWKNLSSSCLQKAGQVTSNICDWWCSTFNQNLFLQLKQLTGIANAWFSKILGS